MSKPEVTVLILNWNGRKDTIECLESLKGISYPRYRVMVVDNGSADDSVASIRRDYPYVELIENGKNLGFAEGNNVGIRKAVADGTDYVLLLNNDTIVNPDFLDLLVDAAERDPGTGVVGPMICFYDDRKLIQSAGSSISFLTGKQIVNLKNSYDDGSITSPIENDAVSGCALLAKREVFEKIGYLNSHYFLYWEETDWCTRAKKAGYRILCLPEAKIWHKESSSTKKIKGLTLYYLTRNRLWFMRDNAPRMQYAIFMLYYLAYRMEYLGLKYIFYYRDIDGLKTFYKGIYDGLTGYPGKHNHS